MAEEHERPIVLPPPDARKALKGVRALLPCDPVQQPIDEIASDGIVVDAYLARFDGIKLGLQAVDLLRTAVEIRKLIAEVQHAHRCRRATQRSDKQEQGY